MKIYKNITLATLCFAGAMQANHELVQALELAAMLPKKEKRARQDRTAEEQADLDQKVTAFTKKRKDAKIKSLVDDYVEKFKGRKDEKARQAKEDADRKIKNESSKKAITEIEKNITLDENKELLYAENLQEMLHLQELINSLDPAHQLKIKSADNESTFFKNITVNDLSLDINKQIKLMKTDNAATTIQRAYRDSKQREFQAKKRTATRDMLDKIKADLYLKNDKIQLYDKNNFQNILKILENFDPTMFIKLESRNGSSFKIFSVADIIKAVKQKKRLIKS